MIRVNGLTFAYGKKKIFQNVSLNLPEKGLVALLGPNGCGKSTLMQLMNRRLKPSAGSISIEGKDISTFTYRAFSQKVAYSSQSNRVTLPVKVYDYILYGLRPHKDKLEDFNEADIKKIEYYLDMLLLRDFTLSYVHELSGGERQKVEFCKALIQETPIIMLDESFSNMDICQKDQCLKIVETLKHDKLVIMVMHDINDAFHYCDYTVLLKDGHIIGYGDKHQALNADTIKETYNVEMVKVGTFGFQMRR